MARRRAAGRKKISLTQRRRQQRYIALGLTVVIGISLLSVAFIGLGMQEINIANVTVESGVYTREDFARRVVERKLEESYFFFIPKTNSFLYPRSEIKKSLRSSFPSIKDVSLQVYDFTQLHVTIEDRKPQGIWCASFEESVPCYFLDKNGLVFARATNVPDSFLVFSGELSDQPLGEQYLDGAYTNVVILLSNIQTATRRTPEKVSIDTHNDISVFFKEGGELRFTKENTNDALLNNIASVFQSRRFQTDEQLEYVDFRFGSEVYVKFMGE